MLINKRKWSTFRNVTTSIKGERKNRSEKQGERESKNRKKKKIKSNPAQIFVREHTSKAKAAQFLSQLRHGRITCSTLGFRSPSSLSHSLVSLLPTLPCFCPSMSFLGFNMFPVILIWVVVFQPNLCYFSFVFEPVCLNLNVMHTRSCCFSLFYHTLGLICRLGGKLTSVCCDYLQEKQKLKLENRILAFIYYEVWYKLDKELVQDRENNTQKEKIYREH